MEQTLARLSSVVERLERFDGSSPASKGSDLFSLVARVENVSLSISQKLGGSSSSSSSSSSAARSAPISSGTVSGSGAAMLEAFQEIISGSLRNYVTLSGKIGGPVKDQSAAVQRAFEAQYEFLSTAAKSAEPDTQTFQQLLQPTSQALSDSQGFKDKFRSDKVLANHLTGVAEGIPALGWVMVSPKPGPHVQQMREAAEFYTTRVLKEYKDKDETHKEWAKAFPTLLQDLQEFVKKYHTTGVVWSGKGTAVAKPAAAAPAAAAPTPTPAPSVAKPTPAAAPAVAKPTPAPAAAVAPAPKKEEPKKEEPKPQPAAEVKKPAATPADNPKAKELLDGIEKIKKNDPALTELNLTGHAACKPEHGVLIGQALGDNTHLKKLLLTNTQVNNDGAVAISNALKTNKTLEVLHLETNNIGPDGILAFAEAIKVNAGLQELKMTNQSVPITIAVEKTLAASFDTNQTIVKFTSPGRDPGALSVIDRAVTRNSELARQKRRLASGTTAAPSTSASASTPAAGQAAKPAETKPVPMGQMQKTIARIEENDPTLTTLDLSGNPVCNAKHGALIGKALHKNTHLKQLMLDGTLQDGDSAVELANALRVNNTLELLSIEKNDVHPDGIKAIAESLIDNTTLTELRLRDQKKPCGIEVEKAFMPSLEKNEVLIKLSFVFKDNGVRNYVNRCITRNTEKARQSRVAEAPDAKKSGPNMIAIQKALDGIKDNKADLTEVNLNDNVVCTPALGISIAKALEGNTHLKSLTMDSTFQNTESGTAFGNALKKNNTLEVLSLEYNDITGDAFKVFAEALATNTGLRELRLHNQKKPTGNEAERALAEALDKNQTLCKLSLVIKDAGARGTIDRVLTRNTEIARTKKK